MSYLTDYKYKKDEIFKRMKVTTLVQLVCNIYLIKFYFILLTVSISLNINFLNSFSLSIVNESDIFCSGPSSC